MDFNDLTNNGVENTPETEPERVDVFQDMADPFYTGHQPEEEVTTSDSIVDQMKNKVQGLAKDERVAKGVAKVKTIPMKTWITIAAVLGILIVGVFAISIFTNTYKTPISLYVKYLNAEKHKNIYNDQIKLMNGLCDDELKAIIKIMKKSDDYEDELENKQENWENQVDSYKEQYGDNYKFSFKVEDKEKLDKDDCKDYQDDLRDYAKSRYNSIKDEYDDYDSDDWSDEADTMGISRSDAKKYVQKMQELYKDLKKAKVTAGYKLDIVVKITGSELDEPEEEELTIHVYKVNGRWVSPELSDMFIFRILP